MKDASNLKLISLRQSGTIVLIGSVKFHSFYQEDLKSGRRKYLSKTHPLCAPDGY